MGIDSLLRIDSLERIDSFVGIDSPLRIDSGAVIPFQISIISSGNRFPIFWESTQPYFGLWHGCGCKKNQPLLQICKNLSPIAV